MIKKINKAFTLLEILLVVAAIAILAGIVILAINPSKQLEDTNNSRRVADVRTISDSLYEYAIDHSGEFPEGIDETPRMLGTDTDDCRVYINDILGETANECLDIKEYIAPVYTADIPYDPVIGSKEKTYYAVYKEKNRTKVVRLDSGGDDSGGVEDTCYNASQVWASANLNIDDGLGGIKPYGNNEDNVVKYGYLYTWDAAVRVAASISGWKLPTDDDFKQLELDLGMSAEDVDLTGYRGSNEGSKFAGIGDLWVDGPIEQDIDFACSGFNAVPGGLQDSGGWTWVDGRNARYWTASESSISNAWDRYLFYGSTKISRSTSGKTAYYSVRLIQE